jgi:hypothetical protein
MKIRRSTTDAAAVAERPRPVKTLLSVVFLVLLTSVIVISVGVAQSDGGPTFGTIPDAVLEIEGPVDPDLVSDYVPALDDEGGIAGYVKATAVLEIDGNQPPDGPIPVVNRDLELVGHMVARRGFVPLGTSFGDVPLKPITVYEMQPDGTVETRVILD